MIKYFIERARLFKYQRECQYYRNKLFATVGQNVIANRIGEYGDVVEKRDTVYTDTLIDDYRFAVERLSTQAEIVMNLSHKLFGDYEDANS